jgi:hypothetical protein
MKYRLILASMACILLLFSCARNPIRTITVQGEGKVSIVPDMLEVSVNVSFTESTLNTALQKTKSTIAKVHDVLAKYRIATADIQTSNVQSNKEYAYDRQNEPIFRGYSSAQSTRITIRDISIFESLTNDLMGLGISGIDDVKYSHSNIEGLLNEANLDALSDAEKRADEMLKHMNQKKGKVLIINSTTEEPQFYAVGYSGETMNKGLSSGGITISTGIMDVIRHVVVTYRID